jgi:DNA-binding XRE family transcriptional regulator
MNNLLTCRTNAEISQEKLAQRCKCSRETIRNIESHKCVPNVLLAINIAETLGVRVEDINWGGEK